MSQLPWPWLPDAQTLQELAQRTQDNLQALSSQPAQLPVGTAGGDLGGTYPDPTVIKGRSGFTVGGQLAETQDHKGAPSGYASLDGSGHIPAAQITAGSSGFTVGGQTAETQDHKAAANGYASLDGSGHVPAAQVTQGTAPSFTGQVSSAGPVFLADQSAPATPTGGGVIYVQSGALMYKGSSGTVTTLGPA